MQSSPLPKDLAHPRGERASLVANVVTGVSLLVILAALIAFISFATAS